MKRIVSRAPEPDVIELDDVYCFNSDSVIAYVTNKRNGMGILVKHPSKNEWGFRYHSQMLQGKVTPCTYLAEKPHDAIQKAMNTGRAVYVFKNVNEFVRFAADNTNNQL